MSVYCTALHRSAALQKTADTGHRISDAPACSIQKLQLIKTAAAFDDFSVESEGRKNTFDLNRFVAVKQLQCNLHT